MTAHSDDQEHLDRMFKESSSWMWLTDFHPGSCEMEQLINLEDTRRAFEEWRFRDPTLEAARSKFMSAVRTFFVGMSNETAAVNYPTYNDEGDITKWERLAMLRDDVDRDYDELEQVKSKLGDDAADVVGRWRDLIETARQHPGLRVVAATEQSRNAG